MRRTLQYAGLLCAVCSILSPLLVVWRHQADYDRPYGAADDYFPHDTVEAIHAKSCSKFLAAAGEQRLQRGQSKETYRLAWLRTFNHPVIVKVQSQDRGAKLVVTELSGLGGYEPGAVSRSTSVRIEQEQWRSLLAALDRAHFWELETADGRVGCDGALWVLEGVTHGRYHVVSRWSPETGTFRDACIQLLGLSRVDADPIY
jgi:hypothetical protein